MEDCIVIKEQIIACLSGSVYLFVCVVQPYTGAASMTIDFFYKYFLEWGCIGNLLMLLGGQSLNLTIIQKSGLLHMEMASFERQSGPFLS
jgi:hypothetical protein